MYSVSSPAPASFTFDEVFDEHLPQSAVYKHSIRKVVDNVLTGYNGVVISLATQEASNMRTKALKDPNKGTIRKASQQVFRCLTKSRKSQAQACSNLVVLCSFVIVINENCHDLLAGFSPSAADDGKILQEKSSVPPALPFFNGTLQGASQHEIKSTAKMTTLLTYAIEMVNIVLEAYRTHATTSLLHHTMCTISVEYAQFGTMSAPISGTLSFVEVCPLDDLADRSSLAKLSKETSSLFCFADVIESLAKKPATAVFPSLDPSTGGVEVFKKSALTQLLKEALGGNCKTLLMSYATKQFLAEKYSQTQVLLKLASRARLIQNHPNRKDLAEKALLTAYMRDLHKRYGEGQDERTKGPAPQSPAASTPGGMKPEDKDER